MIGDKNRGLELKIKLYVQYLRGVHDDAEEDKDRDWFNKDEAAVGKGGG